MKQVKLIAILISIVCTANAQVCLKTDAGNTEVKLIPINNETKDVYVLFKGQSEKVKLKFLKESVKICNECSHPEVLTSYNEMIDDKLTGGTYTLLYTENQYQLTYTRLSDKQNFVFKGPSKTENCTW